MSLDLIVFQGTGGCNLNCNYCYLPRESRLDHSRMDLDLLDRAARRILSSSLLGQVVTILWHAGEPLATGHDWMEKALRTIDSANIHARTLLHTIQTNGTLIDDRWCDLFERHRIKVGISSDGPEFLHDHNRVNWAGRGSFAGTMRGLDHLRRRGIGYIGICVVSERTLGHPDELYQFFVDQGFESVGLNIEEIEGVNAASTLGGSEPMAERARAFLDRLCELWMASDALPIREFELVSSKMVTSITRPNYVPMQDVSQGMKILTVRSDGKLITFAPELASGIPGDPDRFVVGHIDEIDHLEEIFANPAYREMRDAIQSGIRKCGASCDYFSVCGGGWSSNKYFENGSFDSTETLSCLHSIRMISDTLRAKLAGHPAFAESVQAYMRARAS